LLAADARRLVVQDAADREAQKCINRAHPLAVARGEVIVDGDDVDAAPGERVEVHREGGHQRLAFAGRHFGDAPRVQRVSADELHVEWNHLPFERVAAHGDFTAQQAAARVLHHGKRFGQDLIEPTRQFILVLDFGKLLLPCGRLLAQDFVGDLLQFGLKSVDLAHHGGDFLQLAVVLGADDLSYDKTYHDCLRTGA
jgi:hypothetical protein